MKRLLAPIAGMLLVAVATLAALSLAADLVAPGPSAASGPPGATPPPTRLLTPRELWAALRSPGTVRTSSGPVELRRVDLARLELPSGRVIAADPFFVADGQPFVRAVPAGRYPVSVVVATYPDRDQRVAAAMLVVRPGEPSAWQLAVTLDQAAASLAPDEVVGYGVDSGNGSFTSPEAAAALAARPPSSGVDDDPILRALREHEVTTWSWADVVADPASGADLVAFSSGVGDGAYPSWWGLDASGQPLVLVTDFGLLDAPVALPPSASSPAPTGPSPSPPAAS